MWQAEDRITDTYEEEEKGKKDTMIKCTSLFILHILLDYLNFSLYNEK